MREKGGRKSMRPVNERPNLRFGLQARIALPFQDDQQPAIFSEPAAASCGDPMAAVAAALRAPLDHPPLGMAIVPGDQVVIAIGQPIPRLQDVVRGMLNVLEECGVLPGNIRVLLGPESVPASQWRRRQPEWPPGVAVERHQAGDRTSFAYLAATRSGNPVYLNRHLSDADLVLVVSCIHQQGSPGDLGLCGSIYPTFADLDTQRRFFRRQGKNTAARRERDCHEVGWLLGARFALQIVPGAADEILEVVAGDLDAVAKTGAKLARAAWSFRVDHTADLVVTAIDGGPAQQTWQNLYRALEAAGQVVEERGAILACTELADVLDHETLAGLLRHDPYVAADEQLPALDAVQPATLIPSLENVSIYLHSRLADELVEDLGMIPVAKLSEIERICRRSQRPIVLSGGQHVWPELAKNSTALVS